MLITRQFKTIAGNGNFSSPFFNFYACLCIISLTIVAVLFILPAQTPLPAQKPSQSQPAALLDICERSDTITFSCYKKELTNITLASGPEQAFALIKKQYSVEPYVKSQCHQLTHVIGRAAYAKYGNLAETFAHGDQFCWAGYYHGLMEQVADEEGTAKFLASITTMCAAIEKQKPYSFDHYNCVHGLGHGLMEALSGNLFTALAACDKLLNSYDSTSCYGGVFMQNIMTVQSPDDTVSHTSAYLKNDQPMYPCTAVGTQYKESCYLMQTSWALQIENYDFSKVFALCEQTEEPYRATCYQSLGRDASGNTISQIQGTKDRCMLGTDFEAQSNCIIGASKDFVAYFHSAAKGNNLCAALTQNLQNICYSTVKSFASTF